MRLSETPPGVVARKGTFIEFIAIERETKTAQFGVMTSDFSESLGVVCWYSPWRCYVFTPNANTLYERKCLGEMTTFLTDLMEERKK